MTYLLFKTNKKKGKKFDIHVPTGQTKKKKERKKNHCSLCSLNVFTPRAWFQREHLTVVWLLQFRIHCQAQRLPHANLLALLHAQVMHPSKPIKIRQVRAWVANPAQTTNQSARRTPRCIHTPSLLAVGQQENVRIPMTFNQRGVVAQSGAALHLQTIPLGVSHDFLPSLDSIETVECWRVWNRLLFAVDLLVHCS